MPELSGSHRGRSGTARAACSPERRRRCSCALTTRPRKNGLRAAPLPDLRANIAKLLRGGSVEAPSERHLEILHAALALFGERGYSGASLRELARRVGVAQPSLYHWFDSKEQLVEQIIVHVGAELLSAYPEAPIPERLQDIPHFVVNGVLAVWEQPAYVQFLRFLFGVSMVKPRFREAMQTLYQHGTEAATTALLEPFVARGEIDPTEARALVRMTVNAIGLSLIEERVLFGKSKPSAELLAYAKTVETLMTRIVTPIPSE
ncbi:MAG: TetR/AcrR family transcriptional regulator [Polyangiales bacterium]